MEADLLKEAKELFVSNHHGTSLKEIFTVLSCIVQCCLLYTNLSTYIAVKLSNSYNVWTYFINSSIIVLFIFIFTMLADYTPILLIALLLINICIIYLLIPNLNVYFNMIGQYEIESLHYITNYKAAIQLSTAICILAVDFNIFPRRFAKAEVYGIGIMDTAVGAIIFSNALTSTLVRYSKNDVSRTLKMAALLFTIGSFRLFFLKQSSYHEHITEYGLHWNFFFTIAVVEVLCCIMLLPFTSWLKQPLFLTLSFIIISVYQYFLSMTSLTDIIQNGFYGDQSRLTLIDANREGIFSCIGYTSIYLAGLFFGKQVFRKHKRSIDLVKWLLIWLFLSLVVLQLVVSHVTPISRQMANLSYYIFEISFNVFILLGLLSNDILMDMLHVLIKKNHRKHGNFKNISSVKISVIFRAISRNQLLYFLLANVFTGVINMLVNTIELGSMASFSVLLIYVFTVNTMIILYASVK